MQFGLAFGYFIQRNGGFVNLLLITVCNLIPVVGPIVLLGYRAEVSQALLRDEELRRHPKFDFNRFVEYLSRGIWPFLQNLVLALVYLLCVGVIVGIGFAIALLARQPIVALIVGGVLYLFCLLGFVMLVVPMVFHAELSGKFDLGGSFHFAKQFWLTVGGQAVLASIVFMILATLVSVVGLICLIVGVYVAAALNSMAGQHLLVQLYVEYLERGGEPIRQFHEKRRRDDYDDRDDDRYDDEGDYR